MALTRGTRLGSYEIESPLGEGGMGAVYKAHDPTLQRTVAIKVLAKQDEDASARLLQEARAASALNHPHVCTIYEVGEHEGQAFIVMEHVEGKPLSALIPADGLPPESVIRYGTQIADALAHAHERGIVHRDLKSANVVITPEGRAKVLDFGLAARMPQADVEAVTKTQEAIPLNNAGMLVGTLAYMAPEVLRGEAATARSDIWALGGCCSTRWRVGGYRSEATRQPT
jgi:serine/threonine protein kinase